MNILSKLLAALGLPVDKGSVMRREIALGKNKVGKVSEVLKPDTLVQANALNGDLGSRIMNIVVSEP